MVITIGTGIDFIPEHPPELSKWLQLTALFYSEFAGHASESQRIRRGSQIVIGSTGTNGLLFLVSKKFSAF
jgi:hypothetical protein